MIRTLLLLTALTACAPGMQNSSGRDYVAARGATGHLSIDADIARIAAVEPHLHFPARIGVAQVSGGQLILPDPTTADLLTALALRHADMGVFIPVSPSIASMVGTAGSSGIAPRYTGSDHDAVQDIRRAAARQHMDYVLIVEVAADSTETDTALAVADVTLVLGAILPTRQIKVVGVGQALFVDVRNGYPYATAQTSQDLQGLARSFGTYRRAQALEAKALTKTTAALVPEIDTMLTNLVTEAAR